MNSWTYVCLVLMNLRDFQLLIPQGPAVALASEILMEVVGEVECLH